MNAFCVQLKASFEGGVDICKNPFVQRCCLKIVSCKRTRFKLFRNVQQAHHLMYWQDSHPLPFWLKTRHKVELVLATLFLLPRTQSMGRRGTEHKRSDISLPRRITARINVAITAASRSCNCAPWKVCGCTVLEVPDLRSSTPSVDARLESGTRNEIDTKSYLTYAPSVNISY